MSEISFKKIVGIILGLLTFATATINAQDLTKTLMKQGLALYASKDYRGAVDYLGQVVDMDENNASARFYLIYSLTSTGNFELALKHAKKLSRMNPRENKYSILVNKIQQSISFETVKKVKRKQSKAIPKEVISGSYKSKDIMRRPKRGKVSNRPKKPKVLTPLDKAINEIDSENYASASLMLYEIVKKSPENAEAYHYMGVIASNDQDSEEAIRWFKEALKYDPKRFETCFMLGAAYYKIGDRAKAEKIYKQALDIKEDVFAMLVLAKIYLHDSRLDEAEKLIKKLLSKNTDLTDAVLALAQIKFLKGYTSEAATEINKVLIVMPDSAEAHYLKAKLLVEKQLFEDAAEEMKVASELSPSNYDIKAFYAKSLMMSYNIPLGLKVAGDVLADDPENITAILAIAEGLIMSGSTGDARQQLESAESIHKVAETSYLYAKMALKIGDKEGAQKHFQEYIQRAIGQPRAYMRYAKFLENQGKTKEAAQAYVEISEQFSKTSFAKEAEVEIKRMKEAGVDISAAPTSKKVKKSKYRKGKVKF